MKTRYFPIAVLVVMAGQATGAQWKPVSVTPGRSIFMDVEALERKGDSVQAWDWQKFTSEQTAKSWEGKFYWVKSLSDYDCARRMTAPVLKVYFDAEGAEVKRLPLEGLQFPAVVEPDSLREKLLNLACKSAAAAIASDAAGKKSQEEKSPAVPTAVPAPAPDAPAGKEAAKQAAALKEDAPAAAPLKVAMSAKPSGHDPHADAATEAAPRHAAAHLSQLPRPRAAPAKKASRRTTRPNATYCADPGAAMASRVSIERKSDAGHAVSHEMHWTYTGDLGADRWGSLKPEFATCANGRQQSPIDISDGARLELEPITFSYAPTALRIIDNGHTIQVNIDEGRYILVSGKRFDLKQFHFHKPAEERVGGRSYDLVAHLVHKSVEGKLAVVAVLFELGHDNPFLRRLWPYLPMEQGTEAILPDVRLELDKLLPENRGYFTYMGSLTTPPCTEGVLWMVMKTPVPISIEQLAVFARLYPMNARPLQSANGRLIKESL